MGEEDGDLGNGKVIKKNTVQGVKLLVRRLGNRNGRRKKTGKSIVGKNIGKSYPYMQSKYSVYIKKILNNP